MKALWTALAALVILSSCVTYQLRAPGSSWLKEADREVSVTRGALTISATARLEPELRFDLTIANQAGDPVAVALDQVQVFSGDGPRWTPGRVFTADEVLDRQKARVRSFQVTATQAPRYRRSTTTIVTGSGTTTYIVTQPEPEVEVVTTTVNTGPTQADLDRLQSRLWTAATVAAKTTETGWLFAEAPSAPRYKLVVTVAGKPTELVFERISKRVGPFTSPEEWY